MKKYTYWDIKKILAEQNLYLERILLYKCRIPKYRILNKDNQIVAEPVTLDGIRKIFTELDY